MNNDTTKKNDNVKYSSSLMKHTKAQLIEIIFRKDEVEKQLRETINKNNREIFSLQDMNSKLSDKVKAEIRNAYNWKHDFELTCDEKAEIECILKTKIKRWKYACFITGSIMFALIYYIIGYCI